MNIQKSIKSTALSPFLFRYFLITFVILSVYEFRTFPCHSVKSEFFFLSVKPRRRNFPIYCSMESSVFQKALFVTNSSTNDYQLDVFFKKSLLQRKWIKILKGRKDSDSFSSTLKNRWYHNVYHKSRVIITTTSIVIFSIVWKLIVQKAINK